MPYWSDMMDKVTHVYRLYDEDGALLYVGISNQVRRRVMHHRSHKPWGHLVAGATIERFMCRADAQAAEWEAIQRENPKHNITRPVDEWVF